MIHNRMIVKGEAPFCVDAQIFGIAPTLSGYTLQIATDGKNFSDVEDVAASVNYKVTDNCPLFAYKLDNVGDDAETVITY